MGSQTATFVILFIYVAVMISIGVYTSRKTKSAEDFMLGGRSVGSWLTAFSYGTTYFSAVVFIGYAGQFGWLYTIFPHRQKNKTYVKPSGCKNNA